MVKQAKVNLRLIVLAGLVFVGCLGGGCAQARDFDDQLGSIVRPYSFNIITWESRVIPEEANRWLFGGEEKVDDEIRVVTEYFASVEQVEMLRSELAAVNAGSGQGDSASLEARLTAWQERKAVLAKAAEGIIENQIRETLAQEGIFNPIDEYVGLKFGFPPVNFRLEKPPHLLVISPRERIESMREVTLRQSLSLEEMEGIETEVDELGVSSLVVALGGLGATYPTFVTDEASLGFTIDTAAEEWVHQYLVFKPLGFLYLLDLTGVCPNYEIATMNETLASMVSQEIGSMLFQRYYSRYVDGIHQEPEQDPESEFNREMREIRKAVDQYLAQGEVEKAEQFMEQKRQYLASRGYYIRKLNQAYFAFYGTYADSPTSVSPIGLEMKELRNQSASLREFLNTAAALTSRQELIDSIK